MKKSLERLVKLRQTLKKQAEVEVRGLRMRELALSNSLEHLSQVKVGDDCVQPTTAELHTRSAVMQVVRREILDIKGVRAHAEQTLSARRVEERQSETVLARSIDEQFKQDLRREQIELDAWVRPKKGAP